MPFNIRIVSTYPPRRCGIGTFSRDLANALAHFTSEVGHIRIAAIDNNNLAYSIPVDLVIDQYKPQSWKDITKDIINRTKEAPNPTAIILQHEFGLDPADNGDDGQGMNFVNMAKELAENNITTVVYLHTVLDEPDPHQKTVIQMLAKHSHGLIVTTESAIDILESEIYGIDHFKLKHIDHGIRMHHPSQYDRLAIKEEFGLKDIFLATTLGLLSPGKGIEYSIQAYGRFIHESCTDSQRKQIVYVIAGQIHPDFVKAEGGAPYREFIQTLENALNKAKVKYCKVKDLTEADCRENDIVFLETFLDEETLLKLYGATNVMILPYLNMEQISSGILADTLGSGRVAIATKFRYAVELIHSNRKLHPGLIMGRYVRGLLVDPGISSIEQIAHALDYLVFNKKRRLAMERQAQQRGYQMRWANSAWALLQYLEFVSEELNIVTGRGVTFERQKPSPFQKPKFTPQTQPPA